MPKLLMSDCQIWWRHRKPRPRYYKRKIYSTAVLTLNIWRMQTLNVSNKFHENHTCIFREWQRA